MNSRPKYQTRMTQFVNTISVTELKLSSAQKVSKTKNVAFSMAAGPGFSCPGATEACFSCYAQKGQFAAGSHSYTLNAGNFNLMKKLSDSGQVDKMAEMLNALLVGKVKNLFRIHTSGDFFSQNYVDAWGKVIKANPNIRFWTYTRSFMFNFKELTKNKNFLLFASVDKYNRVKAGQFIRKHDYKVKRAYGPFDPKDKKPVNSFVCPATNDRLDHLGACEKCQLCLPNNKEHPRTHKNVVFYKH